MTHPDRVVVVGGGIAGLATALYLAPMPVLLLTAAAAPEGTATALAKGGIAAALGADDAPNQHAADTVAAGAGLADPLVAHRVTAAAPAAIDDLIGWGVPFDRDARGRLALGLEAAHCRRRIVHAEGDGTGRVVLATLAAAAAREAAIERRAHAQVTGLLQDRHGRVCGVRVGSEEILGRAVVLATGGVGGLFAATTNPLTATGTGLAMAARLGAVMRDLEFVQFHPTALATGPDPMPLASEAIRGEGAVLIDEHGRRFMQDVPGAELAPRDVVARAIGAEIEAGRRVFLDLRTSPGPALASRFPAAFAACREAGLDPLCQPIPVLPAAHYHMGGIAVDHCGRSSVPGLWAVGEVAASGLHGANRLASNSLLEGLVFGRWAALDITGHLERSGRPSSAPAQLPAAPPSHELVTELRRLMTAKVGVVRDETGLKDVITWLDQSGDQSDRTFVCRMITTAALGRRTSVGSHYRRDFPEPDNRLLPAAA
ncbi:L-aspartate oxidase [Geminicoccus flavidas]|uniref:L-aspartate oxidase n=1 Tax=Geminicoccus flavidas TaxID=2506407 RepID=UPI001359D294|nr:L-aspartate oxidase [Geminicoccus flavidas]